MLISKAARRYAIALLQIAQDDKSVEAVLADMNLIKNTIEDSRELLLVLKSPIIKLEDKLEILKQLFESKVQPLTYQLIKLISHKKREGILLEMADAYIQAYNKISGITDVEVFTARDLDSAQIDALKKALEQSLSKKVDLSVTSDESLKGGIAVKIGDTIIDGTVKHKLEQLEATLLQTTTETN